MYYDGDRLVKKNNIFKLLYSQFIKNWFSLSLIIVALLTCFISKLSYAGALLKNSGGTYFVIFIIFFISGLLIDFKKGKLSKNTAHRKSLINNITPLLLAIFMIFIVSPIVAIPFIFLKVSLGIKLGILIVSIMPTTLSTGVVMTESAGGNTTYSILITVVANSIAIFILPFFLSLMLPFIGKATFINLDKAFMIKKLVLLVLLPLIIGMAINFFLKEIKFKKKLNFINQLLVVSMVWMAISSSKDNLSGSIYDFIIILTIVLIFHITLLLSSFILCKIYKIKDKEKISIIFMGSQKTLPLSIVILVNYFPQYTIAAMVSILHHITHILIDSFLLKKIRIKTM